jgi:RNA 3'-terminal phosphate cyclase
VTDRLDLTNAFEAAGFERKAAEHVAAEIFDAIRENVATKADLAAVQADLRTEIGAVRTDLKTEIAAVRTELKTEIAALRTELKTEIAALRTESKTEIAALRTELKGDVADGKAEVLKWMFAQTVVIIGGLAALFHLLH